jgi:hypothetical protein
MTVAAPMFDPGDARRDLDALPEAIDELCRVVQGLLLHDAAAFRHYGTPPPGLVVDRTTRPVAARLAAARADGAPPITRPRAPFDRQIGTCRDFALMLCAFLRHRGVSARLRCGFAAYFEPGRMADHWVCEYRLAPDGPWRLADCQLDEAHRAALGIDFDISALPPGAFMTADTAWRAWRAGASPAETFGHGDTRGARFMLVNLARDVLVRRDVVTSPWDGWRRFAAGNDPLFATAVALGDRLAADDPDAAKLVATADPDGLIA